jgi:TatD DNase family protein
LFDTHAHLNLLLPEERGQALSDARAAGIRLVINPSVDKESLKDSASLADEHADVFFCAGIHPEILNEPEGRDASFNPGMIVPYRNHPRFVGIGEIGLDYFHNKNNKPDQIRLFEEHLAVALAEKLPVVLHVRDAWDDAFATLSRYPGLTGEFHCFTGGPDEAKKILDAGFYISFSGILTYPGAGSIREAAKIVPFDRVFLETDTPYLAPVPVRGKPNRPAYVAHLYDYYCGLMSADRDELVRIQAGSLGLLYGVKMSAFLSDRGRSG